MLVVLDCQLDGIRNQLRGTLLATSEGISRKGELKVIYPSTK